MCLLAEFPNNITAGKSMVMQSSNCTKIVMKGSYNSKESFTLHVSCAKRVAASEIRRL
jgi:hypothetical protein